MKKILIGLLCLGAYFGYAGQLTQTTAQVQTAIDGQLGEAMLSNVGVAFTNTLSTSFATVVPPAGYSSSFGGSSDWTVNTNGTVTANFTGTFKALASGSFSMSTGDTPVGHWHIDSTDKSVGFIRKVTNANEFGSFCAPSGPLAITSGEVVTFKIKAGSGTPDIRMHDFVIEIQRLD